MRTIIQIADYDFELPDGHGADVSATEVTLDDGNGGVSAYPLDHLEENKGEGQRIVIASGAPRVIGRSYPLTSASAELGRLLGLWDSVFENRAEYTRLRTAHYTLGGDWKPLFEAMRQRLAGEAS